MKQIFKPIPLVLIFLSAWITYCCSQSLEWDSQGNLITHSFSVWGDWSAHFSFISNLRQRGLHWIFSDNPLFAGVPFQYPFLSHVFTAFFGIIFGMGTIYSTYVLSMILVCAFPFALYYFFQRLGLKPWTALTSVLLFTFIGGFQLFDSNLSANEPVTNQFAKGSVFTQFLIFEFLPQRAFLFGIIAFCLLAGYLLKKARAQKVSPHLLLGIGTSIALMPLLHVHTWIALAVVLLFFFIFAPPPLSRKKTFLFGLAVAVFSFAFIYLLIFRGHSDYGRAWSIWFPGWAQNADTKLGDPNEMNPLWFWIYNTGFLLPFAFAGFWFNRREKWLWPWFGAGVLIFIIALLFNIQPYYYDNLKLFTYSFLFLIPFAALFLSWIGKSKLGKPVAILLLLIQCSSGFSDTEFLAAQKQSTLFFSHQEIQLADQFKKIRSSPDALVLFPPKHNHWVPCLTGNPVVMGYPGWLWSWGIDYTSREKQVQDIFLGHPNALSLIDSLHIEYIVFNLQDVVANQPVAASFFFEHFKPVMQEDSWIVYATRTAP
jgi:hypothetical protein